jgi:hypothetical protein
MGNSLKKFDFDFYKWNGKSDGIPFNSFGYINLVQWTEDKDGTIHVTPQLATAGEVDWYVDKLIENLEGIRKSAKKKLTVHGVQNG